MTGGRDANTGRHVRDDTLSQNRRSASKLGIKMTCVVVMSSIPVQGLTIGPLVKRFARMQTTDPEAA